MCRSGSLLDGFTEYGTVCLDLDVFLSISGRSGASFMASYVHMKLKRSIF